MTPIVGTGMDIAPGSSVATASCATSRSVSFSSGCRRVAARARESKRRRRDAAHAEGRAGATSVIVTATCAAAATMAKSPWRRLTSVKAEPVSARATPAIAISSRHSSGRGAGRHRVLEEVRRRQRSRAGFGAQRSVRASRTCATSGSSAEGRHAPGCRRRCRDCGSARDRQAPAPAAAAARFRPARRRVGRRIAARRRPCARHRLRASTNFRAAISLMSISQRWAQQPERHHRHEALAAGDDLGVVAMLRQQFAGLVDRGRAGIFKRGRFQRATSRRCSRSPGAAAVLTLQPENHTSPLWGATWPVHYRPGAERLQGGVMRRSWMLVAAIAACIAHGEALAQSLARPSG